MKKTRNSRVGTILFLATTILLPVVSQSRFISVDPKANTYPSVSPYIYSLCNPVLYVDPDGRAVMRSQATEQRIEQMKVESPIWGFIYDVLSDPSGAALEPAAIVGSSKSLLKQSGEATLDANKTFQTYTKTNDASGEVLSGRTSGTGTPKQNVAARDSKYPKNDGFGKAKLDESSSNPDAIRGQEQHLIDKHGGAQSAGGTSGNKIRGVSPRNPNAQRYSEAANKEFRKLPNED